MADPCNKTTISHVQASRRWFKNDPAHWALFCLTMSDAHEIIGKPLRGTCQILANGWATVRAEYADEHYRYRILRISEAGRQELEREIANAEAES